MSVPSKLFDGDRVLARPPVSSAVVTRQERAAPLGGAVGRTRVATDGGGPVLAVHDLIGGKGPAKPLSRTARRGRGRHKWPSELSSHGLERWLERNRAALHVAGVQAVHGRGPNLGSQPTATWISFCSDHVRGRAVLWSSGACQLTAFATHDGTPLLAEERLVTSIGQLDDAMGLVRRHLEGDGPRRPAGLGRHSDLSRRGAPKPDLRDRQ